MAKKEACCQVFPRILRPVEMIAEQVLDEIFAGEDTDDRDFVSESQRR